HVVGNDPTVKLHIFQWLHDSDVGGHSGRDATLQPIKSLFFWPKMSLEVQNYVRNCTDCQRNKYDLAAKPGLLQPLPCLLVFGNLSVLILYRDYHHQLGNIASSLSSID